VTAPAPPRRAASADRRRMAVRDFPDFFAEFVSRHAPIAQVWN